MTNKITKREVIMAMLDNEVIKANTEWVDYLKNEIDLLNKKSEYRKGKQAEKSAIYAELKAKVVEKLTDKGQTVTDIWKSDAEFNQYSTQRVTYALTQLVKDGIAIKTIEGRKSLYKLA